MATAKVVDDAYAVKTPGYPGEHTPRSKLSIYASSNAIISELGFVFE
jgi:hypothetical protein